MSYSQGLKMGNLQAMDHEGQFATAPQNEINTGVSPRREEVGHRYTKSFW